MPDYQEAKIYKLWCPNNDLVYIGSTCQSLHKRLHDHKSKANSPRQCETSHILFKSSNNVKVELIEKFPCDDRMELMKREGEWIRKLKCVNVQIQGRTPAQYREDNKVHIKEMNDSYKDYKKEWYLTNKAKIQEEKKKRYQANKEAIKQKSKERYDLKKEEINAKNNEKVKCECGMLLNKSSLCTHKKTQKHINLLAQNCEE